MEDERSEEPERPWRAQREVSPEEARALIAGQFPSLVPIEVEPFGVGWDNTVYRVNRELVFRFPRREVAVPLIETECAVLPSLAPRLPLPIPEPAYLGRPAGAYPWPFGGYALVPGTSATRLGLSAGERARAAGPLGRFLAALHAFPPAVARSLGAAGDPLARFDLASRIERMEPRWRRGSERGLITDRRLVDEVVSAVPSGFQAGDDTLVHGDLRACHVLVDGDRIPCGVIDWGDIHLGERTIDLALAHGFLPPEARDDFRDAYGSIDEDRWKVARFSALYTAVAIVLYAHDVGDSVLPARPG